MFNNNNRPISDTVLSVQLLHKQIKLFSIHYLKYCESQDIELFLILITVCVKLQNNTLYNTSKESM